jgi:hypothetical protein
MFQFNKSVKHVEVFKNKLDQIGLSFVNEVQEYQWRIWNLNIKWPSEKIYTIVWNQEWVNDGMELQDVGFECKVDGVVLIDIEFNRVIKEYDGISLRDVIINEIVSCFSIETGKST